MEAVTLAASARRFPPEGVTTLADEQPSVQLLARGCRDGSLADFAWLFDKTGNDSR